MISSACSPNGCANANNAVACAVWSAYALRRASTVGAPSTATKNYRHFGSLKWTHCIDSHIVNAYPLYDWKTSDIWTAHGRFNWSYNRLYDLYYQAGIPIGRQRVASPFISQALSTLAVYKAIDPDTWGRLISRVNGVNFAGLYGNTLAMGWKSIKCPDGFSWKEYMEFLLQTLPEETRNNLPRQTPGKYPLLARTRRMPQQQHNKQATRTRHSDFHRFEISIPHRQTPGQDGVSRRHRHSGIP